MNSSNMARDRFMAECGKAFGNGRRLLQNVLLVDAGIRPDLPVEDRDPHSGFLILRRAEFMIPAIISR